jgi:hypothetical protein
MLKTTTFVQVFLTFTDKLRIRSSIQVATLLKFRLTWNVGLFASGMIVKSDAVLSSSATFVCMRLQMVYIRFFIHFMINITICAVCVDTHTVVIFDAPMGQPLTAWRRTPPSFPPVVRHIVKRPCWDTLLYKSTPLTFQLLTHCLEARTIL